MLQGKLQNLVYDTKQKLSLLYFLTETSKIKKLIWKKILYFYLYKLQRRKSKNCVDTAKHFKGKKS